MAEWRLPVAGTLKGYLDGQQFGVTGFYRPGGTYFHDGYDFGSRQYPHAIYAVASGQIIFTGVLGDGLGSVIVLKAQGYEIMYQEFGSSMAEIQVANGANVTIGQVIGTMTGTHLHLGMTTQPWRASLAYWNTPKGPWVNPIPILTSGGSSSGSHAAPVTKKPDPPKKPATKVSTCQALINWARMTLFDKFLH